MSPWLSKIMSEYTTVKYQCTCTLLLYRFNTPLHYAVQQIRADTVKYILKHEVCKCTFNAIALIHASHKALCKVYTHTV